MVNETKDYIYEILSKLSSRERREIVAYLQDMDLSATTSKNTSDVIKEKRFNSGFFCPHCNSKHVVRYGYCGEYQRYYCKSCKKTFTDLTGTPRCTVSS